MVVFIGNMINLLCGLQIAKISAQLATMFDINHYNMMLVTVVLVVTIPMDVFIHPEFNKTRKFGTSIVIDIILLALVHVYTYISAK